MSVGTKKEHGTKQNFLESECRKILVCSPVASFCTTSCNLWIRKKASFLWKKCIMCTRNTTPRIYCCKKWARNKSVNFGVERSKNAGVYTRVYTFYSLVQKVNPEENSVLFKMGCLSHPWPTLRVHPRVKMKTEQTRDI